MFLGKISMKEFIAHYVQTKDGVVLNEEGRVIGKHKGAILYTYGERHGFTLTESTSVPLYVVQKDIAQNTIIVSPRNIQTSLSKPVFSVQLEHVYLRKEIEKSFSVECRIRYRQQKQVCTLTQSVVHFEIPQEGIAPGQSLVLYRANECIGGGSIASVAHAI